MSSASSFRTYGITHIPVKLLQAIWRCNIFTRIVIAQLFTIIMLTHGGLCIENHIISADWSENFFGVHHRVLHKIPHNSLIKGFSKVSCTLIGQLAQFTITELYIVQFRSRRIDSTCISNRSWQQGEFKFTKIKWPKLVRNSTKWSKRPKMAKIQKNWRFREPQQLTYQIKPYFEKFSNMLKNYLNWSKMDRNGQKWPKFTEIWC